MPDLVLAALDQPATYVQWGWLQVSVGNLAIIIVMLVLFALAVLVPFPHGKDEGDRS